MASLEEGIEIAEQLPDVRACARGYLYLTLALAYLSRFDEAAAAGGRAYECALAADDTGVLITLDANVGYLHMLAGEVEEGLARSNKGLDRLGPGSRERWQQSYLLALRGICLFQLGEFAPSGAALRAALGMKFEIGDTLGTGYALEGSAWLAAAEALHLNAERSARDALGEDGYRELHDRGAGYPIAELVRLAMAGADELPPYPAPPSVPGQASSDPASSDPASGASGLTGREREIADLVAEGLTNRQIAEQLVISKRTVDAHIEHIYGKLGVSSRVQLASWLRSARPTE